MAFKPRPNTFNYYRLFFMTLLFSCGLISFGVAVVESLGWISFINADSLAERNAIMVAAAIAGLLCLIYASLLLKMISDRRGKKTDRRQRQAPIDFPDRRAGVDRRELAARG